MPRRSSKAASPPLTRKRARARARAAAAANSGSPSTAGSTSAPSYRVAATLGNGSRRSMRAAQAHPPPTEPPVPEPAHVRWARVETTLYLVARQLDNGAEQPCVTTDQWVSMYSEVSAVFNTNDVEQRREMYQCMRSFLGSYVSSQLAHLVPLSGVALLSEYVRRWSICSTFVSFLTRILRHMHRCWIVHYYCPDRADPVVPASRLLLIFWRAQLLSRFHGFVDHVLDLVDEDRRGRPVNAHVVNAVLHTFITLGEQDVAPSDVRPRDEGSPADLDFYVSVFERPFLRRSAQHFRARAAALVRPNADCASVVRSVRVALDEEEARVSRLIISHSVAAALAAAEHELVGYNLQFFLDYASQLVAAPPPLDADNQRSLCSVVNLIGRIPGALNPLRENFRMCVLREGREIVAAHAAVTPASDAALAIASARDFSRTLPFITGLMQLHTRRLAIVTEAFGGHDAFIMALDFAFRSIVNHINTAQVRTMPVIMAYYADYIIRGNFPELTSPLLPRRPAPSRSITGPMSKERSVAFSEVSSCVGKKTRQSSGLPIPNVSVVASRDPRVRKPRRSPRLMKMADDNAPENASNTPLMLPVADEERDTTYRKATPPPPSPSTKVRLETHMDRFIRIFVYIEDKELFSDTFRHLMAKRLLGTYQKNLESSFIEKLQDEMGPLYTSKLIGMLNDIGICDNASRKFEKHRSGNMGKVKSEPVPVEEAVSPTESHIRVLNSLYWPKFKRDSLRVPHSLWTIENAFEKFYSTQEVKRKIVWIRMQSTVEIAATFGTRVYSITMSTVQASTIMLFNDEKQLSLKKLSDSLNMKADDLAKHLDVMAQRRRTSLLRKRQRLLVGESDNETDSGASSSDRSDDAVSDGCESCRADTRCRCCRPAPSPAGSPATVIYEVNERFFSTQQRIRVHSTSSLLSAADTSAMKRGLVVERTTQLDAALVRVMKIHKRLHHDELISRACELVRSLFIPDLDAVEKQLAILIEREYIAIDPNQDRFYLYSI